MKALGTWVDRGVLKEDEEGIFRLLEVAEAKPTLKRGKSKVMDTALANMVVPPPTQQQQQAEQMRMYWKVSRPLVKTVPELINE